MQYGLLQPGRRGSISAPMTAIALAGGNADGARRGSGGSGRLNASPIRQFPLTNPISMGWGSDGRDAVSPRFRDGTLFRRQISRSGSPIGDGSAVWLL